MSQLSTTRNNRGKLWRKFFGGLARILRNTETKHPRIIMCIMEQKLFEVRYNGETFGGIGYDNLREACESIMDAPKGSQVVQVDGEGRVLKLFSVEDCENALRSPIVYPQC